MKTFPCALYAFFCLLLFTFLASPAVFAVPSIPNPSFEANNFTVAPGFIAQNTPITGWTESDPALVGLSPTAGDESIADNGIVPNGTRVAFLRSQGGTTTLSTTISGLVAGTHYRVQFRYNRKTGSFGNSPLVTCRINGSIASALPSPFNPVNNTAGTHTFPYITLSAIFLASGPTATLEISNTTPGTDSVLLVDNFLITQATPLQVTNVNNDGPGSLRQALITALSTPGFEVITFAPALSGQTILLLSSILIFDFEGVAVDATGLAKGIVIDGGSSTFRVMTVGGVAHLRGLTLKHGGDTGGGVAVFGGSIATLNRCTIANCDSGTDGGGGVRNVGIAVLNQCTLTQNTTDGDGGGLHSDPGSRTFLNQCTLSDNTATGAGGGIANFGQLTLTNSIVAGNTAASASDIVNDGSSGGGLMTRAGKSVIQSQLQKNGAPNAGGPAPLSVPPLLNALADNGGPTPTMSLQTGSQARNKSEGSIFTTDQRGRPVQEAHDIGAYDTQPGNFCLIAGFSANENIGSAGFNIQRRDGFEGPASVNISTIPGTATAADFVGITNLTVNFSDGELFKTVFFTLTNDALVEANETFTMSLSAPSAGTTIGTPSSTVITIVDPSPTSVATDPVAPPPPVINSPAANAAVSLVGGLFTITGTATDNKGVDEVRIRLICDDGAATLDFPATLESPDATSTKWSFTFNLGGVGHFSKVQADVTTKDDAGRVSAIATRTFKLLQPLGVAISGNGSVSPAGFTPTSFREPGSSQTLTAVPAPGFIFTGWTVAGPTPAEMGVTPSMLERPSLTFLFRHGMRLKAIFEFSPFGSSSTQGTYRGLIKASTSLPDRAPTGGGVGAEDGTDPSNSTEGFMNLTLQSTGAFSASLTIDGLVLNFSGLFDKFGVARFGTARASVAVIARTGKPSLFVNVSLAGMQTPNVSLTGKVIARDLRGIDTAVSDIAGEHAFSISTESVPASLLGANGSNGVFTVILPLVDAQDQTITVPPGFFQPSFFPQGHGFATMTVSKSGIVISVFTLADNTVATNSTTLARTSFGDVFADLFIPLYARKGFLSTRLQFELATNLSDVTPLRGPLWLRPAQNTHHYPAGWPEVIKTGFAAARYDVTANQSSLLLPDGADPGLLGDNLPAADADGNAAVQFDAGQLETSLVKSVNLSTSDVVSKVPANDPTFSLSISRATGVFTGTFRHTDGTLPMFKGILYQKGTLAGGWGFFQTVQPTVIDYTGENGGVTILGAP